MKRLTFNGIAIRDITKIETSDLCKGDGRVDPPPVPVYPFKLDLYLVDGEKMSYDYTVKKLRDDDLKKVLTMVKRLRKKQPII